MSLPLYEISHFPNINSMTINGSNFTRLATLIIVAIIAVIIVTAMPGVAEAEEATSSSTCINNGTLSANPLCNDDGLGGGALTQTGLGATPTLVVASQIINVLLRLLGFFCLILMLYGGFIWIWARGNEEEIGRAKEIIKGTVIGVVIILSSFAISQWVFYYLLQITNAGGA